jgi:Lon protease-like protein
MERDILYNVPIFPLNTVLFPSLPLPLHIFEERYRQMVRDLRKGDSRFCVALIREGDEVGGPATPHRVACLSEIVQLSPLEDGRFFLIAVGIERVRILASDATAKPYLVGTLELWPDEDDGAEAALVEKASRLFATYFGLVTRLSGHPDEKAPRPDDAGLLSCIVATALQIEPEGQQKLLEVPGTSARLRTEIDLLQKEIPLLRALVSGQAPPSAGFGKFALN